MVEKLQEIIWPTLAKPSLEEQLEDKDKQRLGADAIDAGTWTADPMLFLEEARRLYDEEDGRRKVADSKGTTYLLLFGALIPVLAYFAGKIWEGKAGPAPILCVLVIFVLVIIYSLGLVWWAFKTMSLQAYHRIGPAEIAQLTSGQGRSQAKRVHQFFIRSYLKNTLYNAKVNNDRLSFLKMAHEFAKRTFFYFGIIVLLEVAFGVCDNISTLGAIKPPTSQNHESKSSVNIAHICWYE